MNYKLFNNSQGSNKGATKFNDDGTEIAFLFNDPDNTDYQAYLKWVAEGNTPLPAENA